MRDPVVPLRKLPDRIAWWYMTEYLSELPAVRLFAVTIHFLNCPEHIRYFLAHLYTSLYRSNSIFVRRVYFGVFLWGIILPARIYLWTVLILHPRYFADCSRVKRLSLPIDLSFSNCCFGAYCHLLSPKIYMTNMLKQILFFKKKAPIFQEAFLPFHLVFIILADTYISFNG